MTLEMLIYLRMTFEARSAALSTGNLNSKMLNWQGSNVNRLQQYIMYMYDAKKIPLYWYSRDILPHCSRLCFDEYILHGGDYGCRNNCSCNFQNGCFCLVRGGIHECVSNANTKQIIEQSMCTMRWLQPRYSVGCNYSSIPSVPASDTHALNWSLDNIGGICWLNWGILREGNWAVMRIHMVAIWKTIFQNSFFCMRMVATLEELSF